MSLQFHKAIPYTLSLLFGISLLSTAILPASAVPIKTSSTTSSKSTDKTIKTIESPSKKLTIKPVLSEDTRKQIDETASKLTPEARNELNKLSDALHLEDRAIYNELRDDEEDSLSNVGMLWQAAVERSGTIRYAIEKLSRRDATGKPIEGDSFSKRMLQNLVHLSGVAGSMWSGTPAGLIGSNMVQDIMSGSPQDSALSRVTDSDMVILAKEVESLQAELIRLYYNYQHAKERLSLAQEARSTMARYYDASTESTRHVSEALQPLMQSLYDSINQDEQSAQQAFNSAKIALSLVVGPDAITAMEQTHNKATN